MRHLTERCNTQGAAASTLVMDFDARQKARSRVRSTSGELVGVHIERGTSLKDGDQLRGSDGEVFVVQAKHERLSVVRSDDLIQLARAAYHLGNRHVRIQVEPGLVSYHADHVIDEMLINLGLNVEQADLPFEPEPGAYHRHSGDADEHSHSHGHEHHHHAHTHPHDHHHGQEHEHSHDPAPVDPMSIPHIA